MKILSLDPGSERTGWVVFNNGRYTIERHGIYPNTELIRKLDRTRPGAFEFDYACIEYPKPRGQTMYSQLVDTIAWIGRYAHALNERWAPIDRKDVKMFLCGNTRAKDTNIRAAIFAIFEEQHNIKDAKGKKDAKGPLYGITSHCWPALGVALTWADTAHAKKLTKELFAARAAKMPMCQ